MDVAHTLGLELFLFTHDVGFATRAVAGGIDAIVIDWERNGKHTRQRGADTEISDGSVDDLRRMRAATRTRIVCRINPLGTGTPDEVDAAIEAGADELLLPMVRTSEEIENVRDLVAGRIDLGIMVETVEAVANARELARQPLARVFLGLNDLAIERRSPSIFTALVDGTVDEVRVEFDVPFGVAALTVPDGGDPLPCLLLIGELARLRCDFSILRRSFRRDIVSRDLDVELPRIRAAVSEAAARSAEEVHRCRAELVQAVGELDAAATRVAAAVGV